MNYLQLCQGLVEELGLAGGSGPTSVQGQRGELSNVVRWVRDAALDIDNMWEDWAYLWVEYLGVIQSGSRDPDAPNHPPGVVVRRWDRDSLTLNGGSINAKPLIYEEWSVFRRLRQLGQSAVAVDEPAIYTVTPDGRLRTYPTAPVTYPISGEFWRSPPVLTLDTDTPLMPAEYHRLIIVTAAIKYGNREDAPEVISGMEAEHRYLVEKLEGSQLPSFRHNRSSAQDIVLESDIPGMR